MEKYNYIEAMVNDIINYIKNNNIELKLTVTSDDDNAEYLNNILWAEDCITGNGGYYYDTEEKCEQYLAYNLNLIAEACEEFDVSMAILFFQYHHGCLAQYLDCLIRCYLLYKSIYLVLRKFEKDGRNTL